MIVAGAPTQPEACLLLAARVRRRIEIPDDVVVSARSTPPAHKPLAVAFAWSGNRLVRRELAVVFHPDEDAPLAIATLDEDAVEAALLDLRRKIEAAEERPCLYHHPRRVPEAVV